MADKEILERMLSMLPEEFQDIYDDTIPEAKEIRKMLCEIEEHPEYQTIIVEFVRERGGIAYACSKLSEYVENAKIQLRPIGGGVDVAMLSDIADFVSMRNS